MPKPKDSEHEESEILVWAISFAAFLSLVLALFVYFMIQTNSI